MRTKGKSRRERARQGKARQGKAGDRTRGQENLILGGGEALEALFI